MRCEFVTFCGLLKILQLKSRFFFIIILNLSEAGGSLIRRYNKSISHGI